MDDAANTTTAETLPKFLTVKQAAKELNLSKSHVYRSVYAGDIPHIKVGRAVRIPRSFLDRAGEVTK